MQMKDCVYSANEGLCTNHKPSPEPREALPSGLEEIATK